MIPNKDLSIDSENGKIVLNGDKYDLGTQGEIDTAVKDVYSVMGQMGAKNLIPTPYRDSESKVVNGVTFTLNADMSVTVQTEAAGAINDASFSMRWRSDLPVVDLPVGNYLVSGCPDGGSTTRYFLEFNCTNNNASKSYAKLTDSKSVLITRDARDVNLGCGITIKSGTIITTPITFKPMLRLASDTDETYQPYAKTNKQLTEKVEELAGLITYTDITVNKSTTGYAAPVESAGGVYYEALATYAALGITKDKIINIILVDCHDTAKSFNYYLGAASVGVLTDSAVSIYKDTAAADLTLRIVYKN